MLLDSKPAPNSLFALLGGQAGILDPQVRVLRGLQQKSFHLDLARMVSRKCSVLMLSPLLCSLHAQKEVIKKSISHHLSLPNHSKTSLTKYLTDLFLAY